MKWLVTIDPCRTILAEVKNPLGLVKMPFNVPYFLQKDE